MSFDLFQSRRNYNIPCKWWSRNDSDDFSSETLVMKRIPSGTFMAKEVSPEMERDNPIANSWLLQRSGTTIKTPDNIMGIKSQDLVFYEDELWIVVSVQKIKAKMQQTHFASDKNCSHYWYIELRH
jgi:hypothetical protein